MHAPSIGITRGISCAFFATGLLIPQAIAQTTTRVSLLGNSQLAGTSSMPSLSGNGRYVAFHFSPNPGGSLLPVGLYRRNVVSGNVEVLNINNANPANSTMDGQSPSISGDGRFVAFSSSEPMVTDDTNGEYDVFVRDVNGYTTTRVSVASDGAQGNGQSPSISADGRYVAFDATAPTLVSGDTNNALDAFLHDRLNGTTTRVSVASDGTQGNGASGACSVSGDGRYVAFQSSASNLVSNDANGVADVFVRDTLTGTTTRVSVATAGTEANGASGTCSISGDGRYVAFASDASNLATGDTNGKGDIFLHDRLTGVTTRVSVATDGTQADGLCRLPAISGGGRFVAFVSLATTLVPGGTPGLPNIYVRDTLTGTLTRASSSTSGPAQDGGTLYAPPSVSADGRYVAFESYLPLQADDTNSSQDIYVHGSLSALAPSVTIAAGTPVKSSPTADSGVVYFGDDGGLLHAVDSTSGAEEPGFPLDVSARVGATVKIQSRPAVYYTPTGKYIYFTTNRGDICRVTPDGSQVYHSSDYLGSGITATPAVTPDGMVYVGLSTAAHAGAIILNPNLSTASVTLNLGGAGSKVTSMSVAGNKIYMGLNHGGAGDIMVLNAADLTPLSSGVATGEGVSAPPYVVGPNMYVGTLAGNFYKLNSATSGVDTSFGIGGKVVVGEPLPTSAFYNDNAFYAGSGNGKVWRIGLEGSLSKAYDTWDAAAVVGGVVVERASNTLAFGSSAGLFYKTHLSGGDANIFGAGPGFETTPTYDAATGHFFIGNNNGNIYGF